MELALIYWTLQLNVEDNERIIRVSSYKKQTFSKQKYFFAEIKGIFPFHVAYIESSNLLVI